MSSTNEDDPPSPPTAVAPVELVPRFVGRAETEDDVASRRRWVEARTGARLTHVGAMSTPIADLSGNIENPIGAAQVPIGIAGPLRVEGEHARGIFYVPLATTEGALVRSYERGMYVLTRAGGVTVRLDRDQNRVSPTFLFADVAAAAEFASWVEANFTEIAARAEATTRHGRLLRIECHPLGAHVLVDFVYSTGDASGMNMMVNATEAAAKWMVASAGALGFDIFSGAEGEKRAAPRLFAGGKGKRANAGALVPAWLLRGALRTSASELERFSARVAAGHATAGTVGTQGQLANGLAAMFIACGQDVANIVNAAAGITRFVARGDDLYVSVTLPSLTVGTVGGGTGSGTARECLDLLGCAGAGKAKKLAEIVAATLLAGELSMASAIVTGELPAAHEALGRNRPDTPAPR